MDAAVSSILQGDWLAQNKNGQMSADLRNKARTQILHKVKESGINHGSQDNSLLLEIDRFLDNGRFSERNVTRLVRRIGCGTTSPLSNATPLPRAGDPNSGFLSARTPLQQRREDPNSTVLSAREMLQSSRSKDVHSVHTRLQTGEICTWSEVAKHSQRMEDWEKIQKFQARRKAQQEVRQSLDQQVAEKESAKLAAHEQSRRLFMQQEADLDQWLSAEQAEREKRRVKTLEVGKEREAQRAQNEQNRDQEKRKHLEEDKALLKQYASELEKEQQASNEKMMQQRDKLANLYAAWTAAAPDREEAKKKQYQLERETVMECERRIAEQDRLRGEELKNIIRPARGEQGECGRDMFLRQTKEADMAMAKALNEQNALFQKEEERRREQRKLETKKNKEFLFQQMEARERQLREVQEQKVSQRSKVIADTVAFAEAERQRNRDRQVKTSGHLADLAKQIEVKKAAAASALGADQMSPHELAVNQRLRKEAKELKRKLASVDVQQAV